MSPWLIAIGAWFFGPLTGWLLRVRMEPQSMREMRAERNAAWDMAEEAQHDLNVLGAELALRDAAEAS